MSLLTVFIENLSNLASPRREREAELLRADLGDATEEVRELTAARADTDALLAELAQRVDATRAQHGEMQAYDDRVRRLKLKLVQITTEAPLVAALFSCVEHRSSSSRRPNTLTTT